MPSLTCRLKKAACLLSPSGDICDILTESRDIIKENWDIFRENCGMFLPSVDEAFSGLGHGNNLTADKVQRGALILPLSAFLPFSLKQVCHSTALFCDPRPFPPRVILSIDWTNSFQSYYVIRCMFYCWDLQSWSVSAHISWRWCNNFLGICKTNTLVLKES